MLEIEELLNERKDYMRETCPAYRLVCAEHEALVEILGSWPGISEAFRSYEAYRHMVALRYCAACYQKNKKLSDLSAEGIFTYGENDISQEKILASPQAEDKAERTAFRMLSRLVAEKGKPLSSFWDSYRTAVLYRDDFEAMYSCYFGCQAGAGTPEYKAWIQRYIEPNREYE